MTESKKTPDLNDDDIDILDLITLLWRYKYALIGVTLLFAAGGYVLSGMPPQKWTSRAEIAAVKPADMPVYQATRLRMDALGIPVTKEIPAVFSVLSSVWNTADVQRQFLATQAGLTRPGAFGLTARGATPAEPESAMVTFTAGDAESAQRGLEGYLTYAGGYSRQLVQQALQNSLDNALMLRRNEYEYALIKAEHQREQTLAYMRIAETGEQAAADPVQGRASPEKTAASLAALSLPDVDAGLRDRAYVIGLIEQAGISQDDIIPFNIVTPPDSPVVRDGPGAHVYVLSGAFLGFIVAVMGIFAVNLFTNRRKPA